MEIANDWSVWPDGASTPDAVDAHLRAYARTGGAWAPLLDLALRSTPDTWTLVRGTPRAARRALALCVRAAGDEMIAKTLHVACESRNLHMARQLSATGVLAARHVRYYGTLVSACSAGRWHVARWLLGAVALDRAEDVIPAMHATLRCSRGAGRRGALRMARWLHDRYALTRDDLFRAGGNALRSAARAGGDTRLLRWLRETYDPPREYALGALDAACAAASTCALRWLRYSYVLARDDVASALPALLRTACLWGHYAVVRCLHAMFTLERCDLCCGDSMVALVLQIARYGPPVLCGWLIDTFDLASDRDFDEAVLAYENARRNETSDEGMT